MTMYNRDTWRRLNYLADEDGVYTMRPLSTHDFTDHKWLEQLRKEAAFYNAEIISHEGNLHIQFLPRIEALRDGKGPVVTYMHARDDFGKSIHDAWRLATDNKITGWAEGGSQEAVRKLAMACVKSLKVQGAD